MKLFDALTLTDELQLMMSRREGRIAATRNDPLLFAFYYMTEYITSKQHTGQISLSEFHAALIDYAKTWIDGKPSRAAFIAPRESGKSTWLSNILIMWAAAHGHQKFIAFFADSYAQACEKVDDFKTQIETNKRLQQDFPDLCTPLKGKISNKAVEFNRDSVRMANGFIMKARGADSSVLGMKVGDLRPSLIICDDIEGGESNYTVDEAKKRLKTLVDDIFPLSRGAQIVLVGTTTRLGSIMDQIRTVHELRMTTDLDEQQFRSALPKDMQWVIDQRIGCFYFPAIMDAGTEHERSFWPEERPMEELNRDRHTASFAKNMMCRPVNDDDAYWSDGDIAVDVPESFGNTIISIDPAVTTNKKSDYTGIAVLSRNADNDSKYVYVRHIEQQKLSPEDLRARVAELIDEYGARVVLVETNMGGDLWASPFAGLPAKVRLYRTKENKNARAQQAFHWYQKKQVFHCKSMPAAEAQMKAFPNVVHDDMVDALSAGVNYFLKTTKPAVPSAFVYQYT